MEKCGECVEVQYILVPTCALLFVEGSERRGRGQCRWRIEAVRWHTSIRWSARETAKEQCPVPNNRTSEGAAAHRCHYRRTLPNFASLITVTVQYVDRHFNYIYSFPQLLRQKGDAPVMRHTEKSKRTDQNELSHTVMQNMRMSVGQLWKLCYIFQIRTLVQC